MPWQIVQYSPSSPKLHHSQLVPEQQLHDGLAAGLGQGGEQVGHGPVILVVTKMRSRPSEQGESDQPVRE